MFNRYELLLLVEGFAAPSCRRVKCDERHRELMNIIERAIVLCGSGRVDASHLPERLLRGSGRATSQVPVDTKRRLRKTRKCGSLVSLPGTPNLKISSHITPSSLESTTIFDVEKKRYKKTLERSKSIISKEIKGRKIIAEDAMEKRKTYGVDGVMIGRGAMGNPWIFSEIKALIEGRNYQRPSMEERIQVRKKHFLTSIDIKGADRTLKEMRKHYSNYFKGYHHIKPWRLKLVTADDQESLFNILNNMNKEFND